jgi:EAL domain-containing protein (putative c-di-GMP-specific phosphodiesterase class I)/GGDEF domain-containing protein
LAENIAVPLVVVSPARDPVEALNSLLRRKGIPAHCTWIPALQDVPDALEQINPELLVWIAGEDAQLVALAEARTRVAADVPLIVIRAEVDEEAIAADLARGARDCGSFASPARLHALIERELRSFRLERALQGTLRSAQDYRRQLETVLLRSTDAIAQVQEGILVEANASWLELVGVDDAEAITGQPIMDHFDEAAHPALKGALIACTQGRWSDHTLRVSALVADGSLVPLELVLSLGEREGEPCVRLIVSAQRRDERHLESDLADAVNRNPRTGLLHRLPLLDALAKRLDTPLQGGGRYLAVLRADRFAELERDLGVRASEEFLVALTGIVTGHCGPHDIAGHLSGTALLVMFERGNTRDAEAWTDQLAEHVARHLFTIGEKSVRATITAGLSVVPVTPDALDAAVADALEAARKGRQRGGNQSCLVDRADADTRVQSYDAVWVKHIRAALLDNRFRLVQQPVATLMGGDSQMFDVLIRMIDAQGKDVLPSEFMPAAERNDLVRNIDRWVIGAALAFAVKRKPGCLFVRLSRGSAIDPSLIPWLDLQLQTTKVDPRRICMQVTEDIASSHVNEVTRLANALHERSMRFALDHFGVGRDSTRLIESLPLDYLKIDGSLMQGLPSNPDLQAKVRTIAEAAAKRSIETIAERVEDANTMAVLWQLGVQYLQGYFINSPEEVVMEAR